MSTEPDLDRHVGLCARCDHARRVTSAKGSTFWLCERSRADPRFRKYPPLPVRHCLGFLPVPPPVPRRE
jgi:hypothetical protein